MRGGPVKRNSYNEFVRWLKSVETGAATAVSRWVDESAFAGVPSVRF